MARWNYSPWSWLSPKWKMTHSHLSPPYSLETSKNDSNLILNQVNKPTSSGWVYFDELFFSTSKRTEFNKWPRSHLYFRQFQGYIFYCRSMTGSARAVCRLFSAWQIIEYHERRVPGTVEGQNYLIHCCWFITYAAARLRDETCPACQIHISYVR